MLHFYKALLLTIFVASNNLSFSQDKPEYAVSKIPPHLLKGAEAVIRFEESKYAIESPRKYSHLVSKAITILNADSEEANVLVYYDQYSKAEISSITFYDAAGKIIRKLKKSEIFDEATFDGLSILTDNRVKGTRSLGGQVPYTIEYSWFINYEQTL